jgi:hypothetical protein
VLALASSCGGAGRTPPPANLEPPPTLLARADKPVMPAEAVTSEQAYEAWREDVNDWGEENAGIVDRACWWLKDAGVKLDCRPR